jgi:hypothetical protein
MSYKHVIHQASHATDLLAHVWWCLVTAVAKGPRAFSHPHEACPPEHQRHSMNAYAHTDTKTHACLHACIHDMCTGLHTHAPVARPTLRKAVQAWAPLTCVKMMHTTGLRVYAHHRHGHTYTHAHARAHIHAFACHGTSLTSRGPMQHSKPALPQSQPPPRAPPRSSPTHP